MAWDNAQYLSNVANGLVPADANLYGGSSDTITEDMTGKHIANSQGAAYGENSPDPLNVWMGIDTPTPYQTQAIVSNENGIVPIFAVSENPIWLDFGGGRVWVRPWDTDMRLKALSTRIDNLGTTYVPRVTTQLTAPGEVVQEVHREWDIVPTDNDVEQIYAADNEMTSWRNEVGHYRARGYSGNVGDAPFRGILGPGQTGNMFEMESNDRSTKIWGINPQGYTMINGIQMGFTLVLAVGAPVPAGTPANTLIVRL